MERLATPLHVQNRGYTWKEAAVRYEFTFVVEGADVDDDSVVTALAERLDAMLARGAGVNLLTISQEGSDAIDAARNAVLAVRFQVPEIDFMYLDRDLVGVTEIA